MVALSSRIMTRTPAHILAFNSHMQTAYRELAHQAPWPVELLDGVKHFTEELAMGPRTLVMVDGMQATYSPQISAWFMH